MIRQQCPGTLLSRRVIYADCCIERNACQATGELLTCIKPRRHVARNTSTSAQSSYFHKPDRLDRRLLTGVGAVPPRWFLLRTNQPRILRGGGPPRSNAVKDFYLKSVARGKEIRPSTWQYRNRQKHPRIRCSI